jgi:uncharacterized membrane protein YhaH (DUF805 family)
MEYIVAWFVINVGGVFLLFGTSPAKEPLAGLASICILWAILSWFRFANIGRSPWTAVYVLIPIVNILTIPSCFSEQEGYALTRKLDKTGRWIFIALCVPLILVITIIIFNGLAALHFLVRAK